MNAPKTPIVIFVTMFSHSLKLLAAATLLAIFPTGAFADAAMTKAARNLYQKHQETLVVITAIATISYTTDKGNLPDENRKVQTLGTIIHPKGLIMISNSALDPSVGMKGRSARPIGSEEFVTVTSAKARFPEIQINLADGAEYNAALIDSDASIDLAFLLLNQKQVKERKVTLPYVDISKRINEGDVGIADEVIGLSRSSPVYAYIPSVIPGYVSAISKREHTYYITTAGTSQGVPIFTKDGRFVGLTLQNIVEGRRTNLLGTLAAGTVKTFADLAAGGVNLR